MALSWKLMYRLGFTPWEQITGPSLEQLQRLFADERPGPGGKALDIGCGSGTQTLRLARNGWQVTGIDFVPLAIKRARARAESEGVDARFIQGDVTAMSDLVGTGYDLLVDLGCFHSVGDKAAYAREAAAVAAPGATFLLFAFESGSRRPMPPGVPRDRVEQIFDGWKLTDTEAAVLPDRLASLSARWYRLVTSG